MFPFNMVERMWYVLLCLISNSQLLLPIHSHSLRDGSGIHARVVGNSNGSTVHIVLQRSTVDTVAGKVCPTGYYEHSRRPARRTGRSAAATIVGRSGPRRSSTSGSRKLPNENEDDIVPLKLCVACTVCRQDQTTKQPCTPTQDTICQQCGINTDTGPCVHYDQVNINLATHPPRNDKSSNVQVTLDFSKPDEVVADKSGHVPAPQDLNVNILKAGKDERNSWYFLSLCALIGLLVFLSLVMGAYLVSVKVTSWWRYQRPITVRRRGQSYHPESNHINLTTFPSSSQQRYDDIIPGSREVTRSREVTPREAIKLVSGPEVVAAGPSTEGSYPSTSASTSSGAPNAKIQVVHLRAGGSDFDSVASFDSFVMDGRGFPKARYVDRYYTAGYSWDGNVNKDSSDYSSDDDDDDNCGMERGAIFSPSRPSAIPRTVRGNHLYQSLPLNESGSNDGGCKVHIVQWPSAVRTGYHSPFQMCMNGESSDHYHSAPTQRSVDDLNRGYPSGKHKTLIVESSNCNTFPKNYHPLMNLKREYHHDPHSMYTTQDVTGTISQDLTGATSQEGYPTECTPLNHHSQSLSENSNPSPKQSTAASAVAGGLKYDHRFTHPPQRTTLDDRGAGYQTCQNFHEHRSKSEKSHSYPPIDCPGTFNEMSGANNGTDGPARNENCEPHPVLQEGNPPNVASTSCTNHNTADDPERAQPHME
ncbi:uncharacterized protein LOC121421685 [Lytechinus variegatus]|uniref:uncharacterized protein LOC121421685 n=1 Tax=Lytechinus variegatus TaxID=7654 RepID=UPI001BB17E5C|nr:uncharacterized protein LOC121421685 [Lytechinus variegatus]